MDTVAERAGNGIGAVVRAGGVEVLAVEGVCLVVTDSGIYSVGGYDTLWIVECEGQCRRIGAVVVADAAD